MLRLAIAAAGMAVAHGVVTGEVRRAAAIAAILGMGAAAQMVAGVDIVVVGVIAMTLAARMAVIRVVAATIAVASRLAAVTADVGAVAVVVVRTPAVVR